MPRAPISHRLLDIALGGVRDANKGDRRRVFAGPDHPSDLLVAQRAVLHFYPEKIETGIGDSAIDFGVRRRDRSADDLLTGGQLSSPVRQSSSRSQSQRLRKHGELFLQTQTLPSVTRRATS